MKIGYAKVAQLVEQLICNQPVVGSIPIFGLTNGSLPEWLKGTDCKSVGLRLPWFETTTAHDKTPAEAESASAGD